MKAGKVGVLLWMVVYLHILTMLLTFLEGTFKRWFSVGFSQYKRTFHLPNIQVLVIFLEFLGDSMKGHFGLFATTIKGIVLITVNSFITIILGWGLTNV